MDALQAGLIRLRAPNPSPMTERGTNSYLIGHERISVIDPGPMLPDHLQSLVAAIDGRTVDHILVTHSHLDHSPLAGPLSEATGAPVFAFGNSVAGRSPAMEALARTAHIAGGEGVDQTFEPDELLADGAVLETDAGPITAIHTPGHFGNHLAFDWSGALFSGDLAMGWASSLVSPPDGDVGDFLRSCARLEALGPRVLYPGHGDPVLDGPARLRELIEHRQTREAQVMDALLRGPATAQDLTAQIYSDVDPRLLPAAARNVLAHLIELHQNGHVLAKPVVSVEALFYRV